MIMRRNCIVGLFCIFFISTVLLAITQYNNSSNSSYNNIDNFISKRIAKRTQQTSNHSTIIVFNSAVATAGEVDLEKLKELFRPVLSAKEHGAFVHTLRCCVRLFEAANLSYFLYSGSLIGWYRHNHGMVPWDDDVDIALLPTIEEAGRNITYYRFLLENAASQYNFRAKCRNNHYLFAEQDDMKLKCYSENNSIAISDVEWRWPFIDIHLMKMYVNSTKEPVFNNPMATKLIEDVVIEDPRDSTFAYPLNWIYPLRRAKFEQVHIFVPQQVDKVLRLTYDLKLCEAMWYNHRIEEIHVQWENVTRVNCSQLDGFVKFTNLHRYKVLKLV